MATVLIVSAHPDDECLGAGGTILRHIAEGDRVHWLVVSSAWEPRFDAATIARKRREVEAVAAAYGVAGWRVAGLPCTRLADLELNEVIAPVADAMREFAPEIVYTVGPDDVHTDHHAVFRAVWTSAKPFRTAAAGPRRIAVWETISSTDAAPPLAGRTFVPNAWVDVGRWLERKLAIMALYASESQADPLPRGPSAIRALARVRGAQVGVEHAEAFHVLRDFR